MPIETAAFGVGPAAGQGSGCCSSDEIRPLPPFLFPDMSKMERDRSHRLLKTVAPGC
jgi:hypothetical protein